MAGYKKKKFRSERMRRTSQTKRNKNQFRSSHAGTAISYFMTRQSYKIINIFAQHLVMILIIRLIVRPVCSRGVRKVF